MLRDFQQILVDNIDQAWAEGACNVMPVAPTGSGKTVVVGHILTRLDAPSVAIAHRQELVGQLALALNRERVRHAIIAPKTVQRQIIALEMDTHGYSEYHPRAPAKVGGVHTLISHDTKDRWLSQVQLAVIDEGHHVLQDNIWGRALGLFPNARGLFPTAHAIRADGCGLGREADGLVDRLILAPSCRELIDRGFLTDYRLICPTSDVELEQVKIGPSGEFNAPQLRVVMHQSKTIIGDIVRTYLRFAAGKLGITFAVDIESATDIAAAYRAAGVPAEVITAKTPLFVRGQLMRKFRNRELLQLVSVDVLGEGVDVPALEVVSMARPTASFQLNAQQFGRALRVMVAPDVAAHWHAYTDSDRLAHIAASVKPKAIIIDHVGNWKRHGLPDVRQEYSLLRRETRGRPNNGDSLRTCLECMQPYERYRTSCPYCEVVPVPRGRALPEQVDGDMGELDPEALALLRGQVTRVDGPPQAMGAGIVGASIAKNHRARQQAQAPLRRIMALWGGWQVHRGLSERQAQKLFFLTFGVDVVSACIESARGAEDLCARIQADLDRNGIVEKVA